MLPAHGGSSLLSAKLTKPMDEKMSARLNVLIKPLSFTLITILLSGCGADEVDFKELQSVKGIYYKVNSKEPFSGIANNVPLYNSPVNYGSCRTEIKEGLRDGTESCAYRDGKKYTETQFLKGNKQGAEKRWLEDGFQYADLHWVNGKPDGLNKMWDEKKQPLSEVQLTNGQKSGVEKLWRDGVLEYDLVWENGKQSGKYYYNGYYSIITNGVRAPLLKVGTDEPYIEESENRQIKNDNHVINPADCVAQKVRQVNEEVDETGVQTPVSQDMLEEFKADCGSSE